MLIDTISLHVQKDYTGVNHIVLIEIKRPVVIFGFGVFFFEKANQYQSHIVASMKLDGSCFAFSTPTYHN